MFRLYFISFCFFIFVSIPSPGVSQANVSIGAINLTSPVFQANYTYSPILTTSLPKIASTPAVNSANVTNATNATNTTNVTNVTNVTKEVPVSETNNNTTSFGESIIATFSDPYYYASVLAIFSIITVVAVSFNRRNGSGIYPSKSYDSPGLFTESKESYYIGRPVTAHHHHHHYDFQLSLEKKPNTISSYVSSILSNNSEKAQRPSIKRTQSNESIVSISSSDGLELSKVKESRKQNKIKASKAKRDNKTTTKHK